MDGRWLYGGGHGTRVTPRHLVTLLAAAMTPEELRDKDKAAFVRMRRAQHILLEGLVGGRQGLAQGEGGAADEPTATAAAATAEAGAAADEGAGGVTYSVLMRWGLLVEVSTLGRLLLVLLATFSVPLQTSPSPHQSAPTQNPTSIMSRRMSWM
jgi:hypothetical protein